MAAFTPAKLALIRCSSSSTLATPLRSISSRRMICTGSAVSASTRGSCEPVTMTRCSVVSDDATGWASAAPTRRRARRLPIAPSGAASHICLKRWT